MISVKFKAPNISSLLFDIEYFLRERKPEQILHVIKAPEPVPGVFQSPSPAPLLKPERQATVHSPIGASSMHRWQNCPGSVALSEGLPGNPGAAAKEGTLAHEKAERLLAAMADNDYCEEKADAILADADDEMCEGVMLYTNFLSHETRNATYFGVEKGFALSRINPKLFGTCDAVAYWSGERLLRVYDFKYGKSAVDPEENSQLLYYALGALQTFEFHVEEIELVIVQPRKPVRGEVIRRWRFPAYPRMNDFASLLYTAAKATELPNAALNPGEWCFWCNARNICPAKAEEASKKAADVFDDAKFNDLS